MTSIDTKLNGGLVAEPQYRTMEKWARTALFKALTTLHTGSLTLIEADERNVFGHPEAAGPHAVIHVHQGAFFTNIAFGGSIGAGESFMEGEWHSPDLVDVVRLMSLNLDVLDGMEGGWAHLTKPILKVLHAFNKNTRSGSRNNIAAHYDLGNDFFREFLDPTMMYSAAVFPHAEATLNEAAVHKLDRVCRKLELGPDDHVVEIGTGWGGFAIHAAKNYGCRVTTTTISQEQHAYAALRIREEGLQDRIELLLKDYRDLDGVYDKLVSIEMIEAVGHHFLGTWFEKCSSLLKPDGLMCIQAITMPEDRYDSALRDVDFIKRYIFPGSFIPSVGAMLDAMGKSTDLKMIHMEDHSDHYARTLALWRRNFHANREGAVIAALPTRFQRMWDFYLAYCEGGFWERVIGSAQLVFAKPRNRRDAVLQELGWGAPAERPAPRG
ncbi:SAM-dependent methyltransferase [Acanthopleuribacter pedis]|uniref:Class I SAM-dependent methyltransferase n=1 Tax=Acanthopleuribacter pedis TaxID=442870 RepID=A0A8J7Q9H5_9BACT|nr:cyclopropane-fatty-acyl-phospholipid synthase family protein [Acanthopleuribacter pedis]MBO1321121.1 class I SAM-dependent methyltransferase [Acanthopleuribacter pedis]